MSIASFHERVVAAAARRRAEFDIDADRWPHTRRINPWAFMFLILVVWTLPVQTMFLPAVSPIETKPDRVALLLVVFAMLATWAGRQVGDRAPRTQVPRALLAATIAFGLIIEFGVIIEAHRIARDGNLVAVLRSSVQFVFYATVMFASFHIARWNEAQTYIRVMIVLALIAAVGTLFEYSTDYNVFYDLGNHLTFGGYLASPPADAVGGRRSSVGPTAHGLEITTMLAMMLPFLIAMRAHLPKTSSKLWTGLATIVIIAGGIATLRRTALILPVLALLILTMLHRPSRRQIILFIPLGAVVGPLIAPGALSETYTQLIGKSSEGVDSSAARANDYAAVAPDIHHYFLLGRGQGAFTAFERILDNSFLQVLISTGVLGLTAYLTMLALMVHIGIRTRRHSRPDVAALGSALIAAIAAYTLSNALFDTLSFVHVPYLLLFLVGLVHIASTAPQVDEDGNDVVVHDDEDEDDGELYDQDTEWAGAATS